VDATITVGENPEDVAIDPAGTFAYVTNFAELSWGTVSRINLATNTVDAIPMFDDQLAGVAIDPAGTFAYILGSHLGMVYKIRLSNGTAVVDFLEVGGYPDDVAINPAGTFAYVTDANRFLVSRINLSTYTLDAIIPIVGLPSDVAINPAGTFAYVTSYPGKGPGWVSKINLATNAVDATITVGENPEDVAINPAGTFAYVTNYGSDESSSTVSKVSISSAAPMLALQGSVSPKTLAAFANLTVPNGATISLRVAISSVKFCKVSGSTLIAVKSGACIVTVTVKPKIGKSKSKTVMIMVTK
jgi:YVTN family beta-propeller protein